MSRQGTRLRKFRSAGAIAGIAVTAIVVTAIPGVAMTNASWTENEWASGAVGTEDCATSTDFSTRGAGKLIGGSLLGTDLDAIASVDGVTVTNGPGGVTATPSTATSLGSDAYANPLDVTALSTINVSLGGLLHLPLDTEVGVVNQYGQAHQNGASAGASGAVNDSGGITLTAGPPSASVPTFATLELGTLLGPLGLGGVADLTDLRLALGAVGSSAQLGGCNALWTKNVYGSLQREYVIAGLTTEVDSPLVGQLVSAVNTTTTTLTNAVNGLSGDAGLLTALTSNLTTVLGPVLGTLQLGTPTATLSATVDFSALTTLLNTPITDSGNIVSIDLANGTIGINTAALFDSVNGLNNQAPNTQLLLDATVVNALKTAVTSALSDYVTAVTAAIDDALKVVTINLAVTVPVSTLLGSLGSITVSVTDATLASLLDGTASLAANVECTVLTTLCAPVDALVGAILGTLKTVIVAAWGATIGNALGAAVGTTVTTLVSTLNTTSSGIVTLLGSVLSGLFGPGSALSVVVNAQNLPDPAVAVPGNPPPIWAVSLPGPTASPFTTGQYDISAIEVVLLGVVTPGIVVDLGRASVGTNGPTP